MSVTQDYKSVTLTRFQIGELILAAEEKRVALQEAIGNDQLSALERALLKNKREALFNSINALLLEYN